MKGQVFFRESKSQANAARVKKAGTWTYQFDVPKAGGRRFVTKGGFATRKAAEEALTDAMAEHGRGPTSVVEPSKQMLAVYLREWLASRTHIKASTRAGYLNAIDSWIAPHIGDVRLCDLTPTQITKLYRTLRESGGTTRKGKKADRTRTVRLAESTVHKAHIVLTGALGYAAQTGGLRVNPMTLVPKSDRPKQTGGDRREMRVWTADQAQTFLAASEDDRHSAIYDLALNTGLRRGELAGLRWVDVDLDGGTVAVRRNRVPVNWQVVEGTPKSTKARVVEIDPDTVAMLKRWRRRQLEERMAWGQAWTDSGYLFTREDGLPLHPETIGWHFERLVRTINKAIVKAHGDREGLPALLPVLRLHDLRHTHATLGLAAGVPPKVVQERLGHASIQITLDLYSHVVPGMGADAAAKIGALLRAGQR